MGKEDMNLIDY